MHTCDSINTSGCSLFECVGVARIQIENEIVANIFREHGSVFVTWESLPKHLPKHAIKSREYLSSKNKINIKSKPRLEVVNFYIAYSVGALRWNIFHDSL